MTTTTEASTASTAETEVSLTVPVLAADGSSSRTVDLPAELFGVQTNVPLIHQVVVAQLAAARQGTHKTKNRGEVSGGGKKPYRQKGTGRARQGSTRAPQFTGGGVVHGPTPRDYAQRTPKKMIAAALRGALSDRARHRRIHVLESLVTGETPSASSARTALGHASTRANLLVLVSREDEVTWKSVRNLSGLHVLAVDQLNTYDVLVSDDVVFVGSSLQEFVDARLGTSPTATPTQPTTAQTTDEEATA
jgi:large subunit ribosomal protein L4